MGYFYDTSLFHAEKTDKRDKGMNSTSNEKGTDGKKNNTSEYNHDYYMKNKDKWQDNKKSGDAKYSEYTDGDKDFDDANYDEKNRLGDTDFFGFQKPDGSWVILEEDMKWTLPAGMDRAEMIKALEAFDKEMEANRGNYTAKDWQKAATKAISSVSKKKSSDSGEKEFDVDAAARDVIRGKYGNGAERKAALGEDYAEVQKRVNELMKAEKDRPTSREKNVTEGSSKVSVDKNKKYVRHMEVAMTNNDWRLYQGDPDYLMHHGIRGQKWGVRRFENADGSLTAAGKARYGDGHNAFSGKATAYRAVGALHKINAATHPGKRGRALAKAAAVQADKAAAKAQAKANEAANKKYEAKQAYKQEYKENLKKVNDASNLKDKLIYNDATRKKAAKIMTKNKNVTLEQARKEANAQAWKNTATILAVSGIMAYTQLKDAGY